MFKLFVCVSVLVAAISADYDFKDSDFNELLFDDLRLDFDEDFDESLRFRRDTEVAAGQKECHRHKGKWERDIHCCSGENTDPKHFEALLKVKKECIAEVRGENASDEISFDPFDCERMKVMKEQMVCTAECMTKKFDLLDESGALKRDELLTHLRAKYSDNKWKVDAVEGYVDKCLAELKESNEKKKEEKNDSKKGCNQCPLQFTHCIWREFVQGCPAESQIDSGKCKKIRERLAKGDTSYLHKSFLHHLHSRHEEKKDSE